MPRNEIRIQGMKPNWPVSLPNWEFLDTAKGKKPLEGARLTEDGSEKSSDGWNRVLREAMEGIVMQLFGSELTLTIGVLRRRRCMPDT